MHTEGPALFPRRGSCGKIYPVPKIYDQLMIDKARDLWLVGRSASDISRTVGTKDRGTIYKWAKRFGWDVEKAKIAAEGAKKANEAILSEREKVLKLYSAAGRMALDGVVRNLIPKPQFTPRGEPILDAEGRPKMGVDALTVQRMASSLANLQQCLGIKADVAVDEGTLKVLFEGEKEIVPEDPPRVDSAASQAGAEASPPDGDGAPIQPLFPEGPAQLQEGNQARG